MKASKTQAGFTLVELLVVITVLVILSTFLIPQVGVIRERGRQAKCLENLRIIGIALHTYAADNDGAFPTDAASQAAFRKLYKIGNVTDKNVFDCPSTATAAGGTAATTADSTDLTSTDFKYNNTDLNDQSAADTVVAADKSGNHTSPAKFNQALVSGAVKQTDTEPLSGDTD